MIIRRQGHGHKLGEIRPLAKRRPEAGGSVVCRVVLDRMHFRKFAEEILNPLCLLCGDVFIFSGIVLVALELVCHDLTGSPFTPLRTAAMPGSQ